MTRWFVGAVAVLLMVAVVPARADEKSHRKAAEDLFKAMDMEKTMEASIDAVLEMQVKANPIMAKFKGVMKKFLSKHMGYSSLKEDLVKMYTTEFTEDDLKDMTKFYQTPTGKKLIKKTPQLTKKSMELGSKRVQENMSELKKMIEDSLKKD